MDEEEKEEDMVVVVVVVPFIFFARLLVTVIFYDRAAASSDVTGVSDRSIKKDAGVPFIHIRVSNSALRDKKKLAPISAPNSSPFNSLSDWLRWNHQLQVETIIPL